MIYYKTTAYDVAGGEELVGDGAAGFGGAPFAEPQYALGSAGDHNSLRMQSVRERSVDTSSYAKCWPPPNFIVLHCINNTHALSTHA